MKLDQAFTKLDQILTLMIPDQALTKLDQTLSKPDQTPTKLDKTFMKTDHFFTKLEIALVNRNQTLQNNMKYTEFIMTMAAVEIAGDITRSLQRGFYKWLISSDAHGPNLKNL